MKKLNIIGKLILIGLFITTVIPSCTNLDEELYDVVTPEDFLKGEEQYIAYLGQAYTKLYNYPVEGYLDMNEMSGDALMVPTRGADWDDGGTHRRRHLHSWTYEDMGGTWSDAFGAITDCNRLIESYQILVDEGSVPAEDADKFIAELSALRAFFYYLLVDTYGNVPIVTDFSKADPAPPTKSRKEVFDFIMAEIQDLAPKLTEDVGGAAYGRMNLYALKAVEAKMRLNAGVYTGTPDWQGTIDACDEIINSGEYSLEADFFTNFNVNSEVSSEFILAIPFDKVFATGFNWGHKTLHYGSQDTYSFTAQPWNGFCSLEEFYNSFDEDDLRRGDAGTIDGPATNRGTFVAGYQYKVDGSPVLDGGAEADDPDGEHLNFTPHVNELGPGAYRQAGARVGKWEYTIGGTPDLSNDFGIFRYADILLMKAEAIWRNTGNPTDPTALALVNQVRTTHGGVKIGLLTTLDGPISFKIEEGSVPGGELLNERGREMAFENFRRQDLLRWEVFREVEKWTPPSGFAGDAINTDPTRDIFPIPRGQLESNRKLVQNPGYVGAGN